MPFAQWIFEFFFLCWVLKSSFSFSWRFLCQVYGVLLQDVFIHSSPRSFILCTEKVMPKSLTRTESIRLQGLLCSSWWLMFYMQQNIFHELRIPLWLSSESWRLDENLVQVSFQKWTRYVGNYYFLSDS